MTDRRNGSRAGLSLGLVVLMVFSSSILMAAPPKDRIRIGWVTSLSGPQAEAVQLTYGMVYELWVEQVNAEGGIYVKEYGKKLPIELLTYDDKGEVTTMTRLLEKAIVEDKVDLILPPYSTAMLFAAAPIANRYKYVLLGGPGGALKLREVSSQLPYFFSVLNMADTQMPALAKIFKEVGVKKVALIYQQDMHGIEYRDVIVKEFAKEGIRIALAKSFAMDTKDLKPLLQAAKAAGVDALVAPVYPNFAFMITSQAMEIGFSPKALYMTVGPDLAQYRDTFGVKNVEGIMGGGAWNAKVSAGAKKFISDFVAKFNAEPEYWGTLMYYSSLQFLKQAIEEAGTLDQSRIRDLMASRTYETAMGPMSFKGGFSTSHPGQVGQWQNGVYEIIDPGPKRTAAPLYPKPAWQPMPKQAAPKQ